MASEDTKTKILDAAEQLFAEEGYAATSMRTITAEAGVNLASVNYHFGSKEALLAEVLGRRLRPINGERLRRLDEVEAQAGDHAPDLEDVVRAFVEPVFHAMSTSGDKGPKFVQLIGRAHVEASGKLRCVFLDQFKDTIQRFIGALRSIFPELSEEEVRMRLFFMVGAMAHTLAWGNKVEWLVRDGEISSKDPTSDLVEESLVQFAAAGMRGSVPAMETEGPNENRARS